jgi:CRP-like cAMP-binding protein
MSTFEVLRRYLEAKADFSAEDFAFLKAHFVPRTLKAGDFFLRAGDVPTYSTFVASGCLRRYVIDPDGNEHVVQFAPENWWTGDDFSLMAKVPTQFFVDALEDSKLLMIDLTSHLALVQHVPGYALAFRTGLQRHVAAKDRRIISSLSATAEERYLEFVETYPSIALRVPQWMVASYLGVSPETISRIRRKLSRRTK